MIYHTYLIILFLKNMEFVLLWLKSSRTPICILFIFRMPELSTVLWVSVCVLVISEREDKKALLLYPMVGRMWYEVMSGWVCSPVKAFVGGGEPLYAWAHVHMALPTAIPLQRNHIWKSYSVVLWYSNVCMLYYEVLSHEIKIMLV